MPTATARIGLLRAAFRERQRLLLENAALRHQLAVLKRSITQPRIEYSDRIFWIILRRRRAEWRACLHFVKPDTVVRWHRRGFRYYWRPKSKPKNQAWPPIDWRLASPLPPRGVTQLHASRNSFGWGDGLAISPSGNAHDRRTSHSLAQLRLDGAIKSDVDRGIITIDGRTAFSAGTTIGQGSRSSWFPLQ